MGEVKEGTAKQELAFTFEDGHLAIVGQGMTSIPNFPEKIYPQVISLDLSFNQISVINGLEKFAQLKNLVLDNNEVISEQNLPKLDSLDTLWVNGNNITDLKIWIDTIVACFPNLTYLSMMKNPACPNFFNGRDQDDYQRYRYYVLSCLKKLRFLDSSPVTPAEQKEANRVGHLMLPARPDPAQYIKPVESDLDLPPGHELPSDLATPGQGSVSFGKTRYVYYGRQSEGNRFILNSDL